MVKSEWPDRFILNHQSGDPQFSHLGFADCYITGEDFYSDPFITRDANYYRAMDLDNCHANMAAAAWGVPVAFLSMAAGSPLALMTNNTTEDEMRRASGRNALDPRCHPLARKHESSSVR